MLTSYGSPASQRPSSCETEDVPALDLPLLRLISDAAAELPLVARIVEPRELDPCSICPEQALPGDAVITYRTSPAGFRYLTVVCRDHLDHEVTYHRRRAHHEVTVLIPAPLAGAR